MPALIARLAFENLGDLPDRLRSSGMYILDAKGEPEPCQDIRAWGDWMGTAERHLYDETVGGHRVSTIFLGLDHGFGGVRLLWETCVFGGFLHGEINRYATRQEANDGHHKMCAEVRESMQ